MAEWRIGRGWSEKELEERLNGIQKMPLNFPLHGPGSQDDKNWRRCYSESIIAREAVGAPVPDGAFFLAWKACQEYQFSDPATVTAHFRPKEPLEGRSMLLELKVMTLRYLCGTRVSKVRKSDDKDQTQYGFRYDTLENHIEVGSEWFVLTKNHHTGEIWFRISASWRPGDFPNWWSRLGFEVLGQRYQLHWHRMAYLRLRDLVSKGGRDLVPVPYGQKLIHTGADINNSDIWKFAPPKPDFEKDQSSASHSATH